MKPTEEQITEAVNQWVKDELARITGEMFGGDCHWSGDQEYVFEPNLDYAGTSHEDK